MTMTDERPATTDTAAPAAPPRRQPPALRGKGPQITGSRPPSRLMGNPRVLAEGEEGGGKTTAALLLSRDPRVGEVFVVQVGEDKIDEYGRIPDTDYEVLEHDGTYAAMLEKCREARDRAVWLKANGETRPPVLIFDSFSMLDEMLKDWVTDRARSSRRAKQILADDPNAVIEVGRHLWNDRASRYAAFRNVFATFPGIVVLTARGKEVSATRPDGSPDPRLKEWSVEGHKSLGHDVTIQIRFRRNQAPEVITLKGGNNPLWFREKATDGRQVPAGHVDNPLPWAIFEAYGYEYGNADTSRFVSATPGELTDEERSDEDRTERTERRDDAHAEGRATQGPPQRTPEEIEQLKATVGACVRAAANASDRDALSAVWRGRPSGCDAAKVGPFLEAAWAPLFPGLNGSDLTLRAWFEVVGRHITVSSDSVVGTAAANAQPTAQD